MASGLGQITGGVVLADADSPAVLLELTELLELSLAPELSDWVDASLEVLCVELLASELLESGLVDDEPGVPELLDPSVVRRSAGPGAGAPMTTCAVVCSGAGSTPAYAAAAPPLTVMQPATAAVAILLPSRAENDSIVSTSLEVVDVNHS